MDPKGANLASTDLLEISELVSGSYVTKSITGAEIVAGATTGLVPTTRTISTTSPLSGGGDLSANRTLSIATANTTTTGALSSTDWNTFNNKVPTTRTLTINGTTQDLSADRTFTISTGITIGTTAITSGTDGRVLFQNGGVVSQSANLFFDVTNGRFGVGTSTPSAIIHSVGSVTASGLIARANFFNNTLVASANNDVLVGLDITPTFTNGAFTGVSNYLINMSSPSVSGASIFVSKYAFGNSWIINLKDGGTTQTGSIMQAYGLELGSSNSGLGGILKGKWGVGYGAGTSSIPVTLSVNGSLGVGITTDAGYKLDVNGTARVSGGITLPFSAGVTINSSTNDLVFNVPFYYRIMATGSDTGTVISSMWNGTQMINGLNRRTVITNTTGNGTSSGTITASAILDVQSTTLGFLPPRMTTTQKNAIASPATGLMVYDTTLNLMALYNGTVWTTL